MEHDAVEVAIGGAGSSPVLVTCEHASNRMPQGFEWSEADHWARETHWAYDIGAADLSRELARSLESVAVLSRFSRLLVDPNRRPTSSTLFRTEADGRRVAMNVGLTEELRRERMERFYTPYHDEVGRRLRSRPVELVLAIHTFTPVYEGRRRDVEVGVLHCGRLGLAQMWRGVVARSGLDVRVDEPYAGSDGLMFSAHHHAEAVGATAIEIELRQDFAADPTARAEIRRWITVALEETGVL